MICVMSVAGCKTTLPSAEFIHEIKLPVPASALSLPDESRLSGVDQGKHYKISALSLISITFDLLPDIKSSYQRFKSEEARYDFFYSSRDSLTPRFTASNSFSSSRNADLISRHRDHTVALSVEKQFFDTTRMEVGVGYRTTETDDEETDDDIGNTPFVSANIRYPFSASREKLERTSEDIFRRNELDDVQLGYIQQIRRRLQDAMFQFYRVSRIRRDVAYQKNWLDDLIALNRRLEAVDQRDTATDLSRLQAEIARVTAEHRNNSGWFKVQMTRLKVALGLAFHVQIELLNEPFNPFEGQTHQELLRLSIETDPEIATLRNSVRNAEVQLDLARRGRWDIALLVDAASNLEGRGANDGISDWNVSVGLDISVVDPRVTDSLSRQAQSSISRFQQAIAARENAIYADTFEPLIRIDTLGQSRTELKNNLPRFQSDYDTGVKDFFAGKLNIDDLLLRRQTLTDQQFEISSLTMLVGANVAELCSATGKFFELINGEDDG